MRYRTLGSSGPMISELGLGASPLGGIYGTFAEQDGIAAVHCALDAGINFLDVSPYYGLTAAETVLGKALHGIGRDRYVLATKVGRYGDDAFDFSAARVTRSVRESMGRLGVGHIDLIQCHDVEFGSLDQVIEETIPALRALQDAGLVRWVGVTGYPLPALLHIAGRTGVDTVMSYCQYTLQDRRLAASAAGFAAAGAAVINASPLAMGALTDRGAPPWHPAPPGVLDRCAQAAAVCRKRGASLARLALQFSVTTSPGVTTVVGSSRAASIKRDVAWISEPIDTELLAEVEAVLAPARDLGWLNGRPENQDPGRPS
jgi:aryl-alcohol dehydrogenase-like predicted oxidoreductase